MVKKITLDGDNLTFEDDVQVNARELDDITKGTYSAHGSRHTTGGDDAISGIVTETGTQTLTNKRITKRLVTIASSAAPTPNGDITDVYTVTALAVNATFGAITGTPTIGQTLIIRIKDDNVSARVLAWNNGAGGYRAGTDIALPLTTIKNKTMYLGFIYNLADTKWDLIAYVDNI